MNPKDILCSLVEKGRMYKLLLVIIISISLQGNAQDLTGTWEGEFTRGTIGLTQTAKMQLELVEVEGKKREGRERFVQKKSIMRSPTY